MKLFYVTIKVILDLLPKEIAKLNFWLSQIISVTGYQTMTAMIESVGSLHLIPELEKLGCMDTHAVVRHRSLEYISLLVNQKVLRWHFLRPILS